MPWIKKESPRYNHVQTRLSDEDYAALKSFAEQNGVNYCRAAEALIITALKMVAP